MDDLRTLSTFHLLRLLHRELSWVGGSYSGFNDQLMASQANAWEHHAARLGAIEAEINHRFPEAK